MTNESNLILIVDDNPTNLSVIASTLTNNGFEIAVEADGESAIAQVELNPPDLILLDVKMPGIDGFETCDRLKKNPQTQDIPVIFMTALSETTDKVKGFSLGAVDYITKPFQQEEVLARVRLHLRLRSLTKTLERQNLQLKDEIQQRVKTEAELQTTLQQLQSAQNQIVAQEKLAFLGSLTAGIAHEIRNPLNFVTNFAEGSVELTEELVEEIESQTEGLEADSREIIREILNDLKENSESIARHGKRAERIISDMLMHARHDRSERQRSDINVILADAVKLGYHGMRAKDSSFNVTITTEYDESIAEMALVPPSLSRAFINMIANSCYALRDKQTKVGDSFTPTLSVKTANLEDWVEIRIADNGPGIAAEHLSQIFNPFFTTKSPTEGTGLGLSLTHEIIVGQHQGDIKVESDRDRGTEFIISLPKNMGTS